MPIMTVSLVRVTVSSARMGLLVRFVIKGIILMARYVKRVKPTLPTVSDAKVELSAKTVKLGSIWTLVTASANPAPTTVSHVTKANVSLAKSGTTWLQQLPQPVNRALKSAPNAPAPLHAPAANQAFSWTLTRVKIVRSTTDTVELATWMIVSLVSMVIT